MTEPQNSIEIVSGWQHDENGDEGRIVLIKGIEYFQYKRDQTKVRRYRKQPTAPKKEDPRYKPKTAPKPSQNYLAQRPNNNYDHRISRPEIVQVAPFALFPRENDSELAPAHPPSDNIGFQASSTNAKHGPHNYTGKDHKNTHEKNSVIEPGITRKQASAVPPQVVPHPSMKAPNSTDPGKARQTSSLLSVYGQEFVQIREGDYIACQEFMARYPGVHEEDPNNYLKEALRLQIDRRTSHVRNCIQQLLLLRQVSKMSQEQSQIFFNKMKSREPTTFNAFLAEFGAIYEDVKSQAGAAQWNPLQPLYKTHRPEHAVSEDTRRNQVPENPRHAPGPPRHPSIDEGLPASVGRLNLSTPGQQDTVRSYATGGNGMRASPVTHRSSTRRRDTLTSVHEGSCANLSSSNPPQGGAASFGDNFDIQGNGEGKEELDHRYYVRTDGAKFFKVGRVFAMLWHEGAGDPKGGHMSNKEQLSHYKPGKYGQRVYSHILRMAVVRERHGYCWCIPIHTYNGRGVLKPGFNQQDQEAHAIIHMDDTEPGSTSKKERDAMIKEPIAVHAASLDQKLHIMSRLNFGKPYSVQMNVKVMDVGKVTEDSMPAFESYWRIELSGA